MQGQRKFAHESWKEFKAIRNHFEWPCSHHDESTQEDSGTRDFDGFEKTVQHLKKEIEAVHRDR